jgi:hypothetical protein
MNNDTHTNLFKIVTDMTEDLIITFPEHSCALSKWTRKGFNELGSQGLIDNSMIEFYNYAIMIFPERFFDIIYQNDKIFLDTNINTCFLPLIDFKILFNSSGISESTREVMWNYLKLILLTIVNSVKDKSTFGDTNQLFNDIDEEQLLSTLTETMSKMSDFFQNNSKEEIPEHTQFDEQTVKNKTPFDIPNADDVFGHLKGLFDGKIGKLVKELAEEISQNLADVIGVDDMNDVRSTKDVVQKLMQNPKKFTDLFKTINVKLQSKLQSGEISQDELLKEVTEFMSKIKGDGGNNEFDFQEVFKSMSGAGGAPGISDMMNMMKGMFKPEKKPAKENTKTDKNNTDTETNSRVTLHEKMKNRMLVKKLQQAELQLKEQNRISEASKNFVPYIETSFTVDGEDKQLKSNAKKQKNKKNKNKK